MIELIVCRIQGEINIQIKIRNLKLLARFGKLVEETKRKLSNDNAQLKYLQKWIVRII